MCSVDLDSPEVFSDSYPKARKEHRCCECGAPIPVGTRYRYIFGVWDGNANSFKMHVECEELRDKIEREDCGGEGEIPFTELRQEIAEHEDTPGPLHAALDAIRRKYMGGTEGRAGT